MVWEKVKMMFRMIFFKVVVNFIVVSVFFFK